MYINCKTYFSFRYGTMSVKDLVQAAVERGVPALALTNINSTCDIWDFVKACREENIQPITGVEIRNEDTLLYILIAANNDGLAWINEFLSDHLMEKKLFPAIADKKPFFSKITDGFVIYPLHAKKPEVLFLNERIGIRREEVNKLFTIDIKKNEGSYVICQPVTFLDKRHFNVHRLLRSIDKNILLSKLPLTAQCSADESFVSPSELLEAFQKYPSIVTNTYKLMEACTIEMEFYKDKNKKVYSGTPDDDKILLAKLAKDGLGFRYPNNKIAKQRVEKELKIIDQLGFNAYFLITCDLVRYAQSRGFYHVGRGSGANSVVAFCLQITDVDPIELDLYFERFLNPYRTSPPDFDIDFSWLDREEMTDYIFKRYGKKQVALLGMYATFQYKATIGELGKVFGLPREETEQLIMRGTANDTIQAMILRYGKLIENFPNHISPHPGGILISEEPITNYATLFMPPKGFATVQMDMFVAENVGLYKLDILSQRGLGHIREAVNLVKQNQQVDINIHAIEKFKKDPLVNNQIKTVKTIGCFYIESPAMRGLLKKLECDDYITLVAASSIIRPGVSSSGMMKSYIERYHDPENINYIHPIMKELMEETYGVMVYQEDVIKVAHHFAGLDMGEADILRRAMSGKYRGNEEMKRIKLKFFTNCTEKGYPDEISAEIWRQIESFGGYSFSKAHSASYAVESYQSLFLKTYYPKEFMVAVINNFGGFYSRELYFLELRKTGATIHLPCVNESIYSTSIKGNDVYMGFVHIKSLEIKMAETLIEERMVNGIYLHLQDFIERTACTKEQLNILVSIGAFSFTGKSKKQLLWEANFLQANKKAHIPARESLFEEDPVDFVLPVLTDNRIDDLYDQMELLDFPLCNPFEMVADDPHKYLYAKDLAAHLHKEVRLLGYFITYKPVTTIKNERMAFGNFLDVNLDWIDTVHFPDSLKIYPLKGRGFYVIVGKVVQDFGVYSVEVSRMSKVGYSLRVMSYKL